ncbi:MAG: YicC/YloC family endoribonuclease [Candidatus Cloacimonadaceae bacterium]
MKSMTGFGKCHQIKNDIECDIEIKSINGRYLDLKLYLPRELNFFEYQIRKVLPTYIRRGTVELRLSLKDFREPRLVLNKGKLLKYYDIVKQAQAELGLDSDIALDFLLAEPGVIEASNNLIEDKILQEVLNECLHNALDETVKTMEQEAEGIAAELKESMNKVTNALNAIVKEIPPFKQNLYETMHIRITEIMGKYNAESLEQRLMQELALYVDRYDIQEEITRLHSHIKYFWQCLEEDKEDMGKTLNFITQEMQREANTLGSKFSTANTFKDILIIKEEIEKCREIVQNVS